MQPNVVVLNEIEKFTSWGNQDQPEVYKNLLQSKTGKTWYYIFAQEFGAWSSNGKGNLILSTVPFSFTDRHELVHNADRSIAEGIITWGGRRITLISTHLDPYSQPLRLTQATEVTTWAAAEPENRILTGDMNAWPDQTSIAQLDKYYYDSWAVAASHGTVRRVLGQRRRDEERTHRLHLLFEERGALGQVVAGLRHARLERRDAVRSPAGADDVHGAVDSRRRRVDRPLWLSGHGPLGGRLRRLGIDATLPLAGPEVSSDIGEQHLLTECRRAAAAQAVDNQPSSIAQR